MKDVRTVRLTNKVKCDYCSKIAEYDSRTGIGAWAYLCREHFEKYGIGLGLGKGQKIIYAEQKTD
nr:hypothetical protein [uncultured bacterium]